MPLGAPPRMKWRGGVSCRCEEPAGDRACPEPRRRAIAGGQDLLATTSLDRCLLRASDATHAGNGERGRGMLGTSSVPRAAGGRISHLGSLWLLWRWVYQLVVGVSQKCGRSVGTGRPEEGAGRSSLPAGESEGCPLRLSYYTPFLVGRGQGDGRGEVGRRLHGCVQQVGTPVCVIWFAKLEAVDIIVLSLQPE